MWKKFWKEGQLPTLQTEVGINTADINRAALTFFIAAVLVILAYFSIKKLVR